VYAFEASIAPNVELGRDLPPAIRPDYGVGVVGSILGGTVEQIDDNFLWVRPSPTFLRITTRSKRGSP
jgi:hypothetical protein